MIEDEPVADKQLLASLLETQRHHLHLTVAVSQRPID